MGISAKVISDSIISPLGLSTSECVEAILKGETGLKYRGVIWPNTEPVTTAKIERKKISSFFDNSVNYTFFEQIAILAVKSAVEKLAGKVKIDLSSADTLFVLSTTKGNIELLEKNINDHKLGLYSSALAITSFFNNSNRPVVISNACISGVAAIIEAKRYIENKHYKRVVVVGADVLSKFVVSGFQSFKALSADLCRPFDKLRCGLNIGEGAAAIILEGTDTLCNNDLIIEGGGMANDANHISGPSRTGEGLYRAINDARYGVNGTIDFINTHGTATSYNDEMESIALSRQSLLEPPLSSFKGYFGHTLGAAGVIESVVCLESMRRNVMIGTKGFETLGVSMPVNVLAKTKNSEIKRVLKTASGFGGSNAAIIISKI